MRILIMLRGIPGAGKSTFIKKRNLQNFTIESDAIRVLLNQVKIDEYGNRYVPQDNRKLMWNFIYDTMRLRMSRGELVLLDGTNTSREIHQMVRRIAKTYNYRFYVVDFTPPLKTMEEKKSYIDLCYRRCSATEDYKFVDRTILENMLEDILKYPLKESISPQEFNGRVFYRKYDLNNYEKVNLISDIHGNYTHLRRAIPEIKEDEFYLFLGDYIDRGYENSEVIEWIYNHLNYPNMVFLIGNHERWLQYHARSKETMIRSKTYKLVTKSDIESLPNWREKIKAIVEKLHQVYYFTYNGDDYLCSHAGVSYFDERIITYSSDELEVNRSNKDVSAKTFNRLLPRENLYQVHGHISFRDWTTKKGNVYNINSTAEFGGYMYLLEITRDGRNIKKYKGGIDTLELDRRQKTDLITRKLRIHPSIETRKVLDNIICLSFTKDAFFKRRWDKYTIRARGLFYDLEAQKIVMRGYNKFFDYGEMNEIDDEDYYKTKSFISEQQSLWDKYWSVHLEFPLTAYKKENGFLGMVSLYNGEVLFGTKTNILPERDLEKAMDELSIGNYKEEYIFADLLLKKIGMEKLKSVLKKHEGYTLLFENMDIRVKTPVIEYPKPEVVLLDGVKNSIVDNVFYSYNDLKKAGEELEVPVKEKIATLENWKEMKEFVAREKKKVDREGVVVEDRAKDMFKVKTDYFLLWTKRKKVYDGYVNRASIRMSSRDEKEFLKFLVENKIPRYLNIWAVRDIYENRLHRM